MEVGIAWEVIMKGGEGGATAAGTQTVKCEPGRCNLWDALVLALQQGGCKSQRQLGTRPDPHSAAVAQSCLQARSRDCRSARAGPALGQSPSMLLAAGATCKIFPS